MASEQKRGAWNSTKVRPNTWSISENCPSGWALCDQVRKKSWKIMKLLPCTLQTRLKLGGKVLVHRYINHTLWNENTLIREWVERNSLTTVITPTYAAASWIFCIIFPTNLDCIVDVNRLRFRTTDAASCWDTWVNGSSTTIGWEEGRGGVFQRAMIASSKIFGHPSLSVSTLA